MCMYVLTRESGEVAIFSVIPDLDEFSHEWSWSGQIFEFHTA